MNLFKSTTYEPQFEKIAGKRLSPKVTEWSKEVLDYFYDTYPVMASGDIKLVFKNKNEKRGAAVGAIYVGNQLAVPIIIEDFVVYPLDVAILTDGSYVPFNNYTIDHMLSNPSAFAGLKDRSKEDKIRGIFDKFGTGYEPTMSVVKNASAEVDYYEKVAEFVPVSVIKSTIAHIINSDDRVKTAMNANSGAKYALERLMARESDIEEHEGYEKVASYIMDRDIYLLEKTGTYEWCLRVGSSGIDDPIDLKVDEEDIADIPLYRGMSAEKTAHAQDMEKVTSCLFDNGSDTIYIDEKGRYAADYGKLRPANYELLNDDFLKLASTLSTEPKSGMMGVITINGMPVVEPFDITKIAMLENHMTLHVNEGFECKQYTLIRPESDSLWENKYEKNAYYVPGNAQFWELSEITNAEKLASINYTSDDVFVHKITRDAGQYRLRGREFEKYAEVHPDILFGVNSFDAKWAALQLGASEFDVEKIAELKDGETHTFSTRLEAPVRLDKLASAYKESVYPVLYADNTDIDISELRDVNWTKLAASAMGANTVDALLSLNFLTKKSLKQFFEMVPSYKLVLQQLAQLLLLIRLGYKQIPEEPVQDTLNALSKVIVYLEGVSKLKGAK